MTPTTVKQRRVDSYNSRYQIYYEHNTNNISWKMAYDNSLNSNFYSKCTHYILCRFIVNLSRYII